MEPKESEETTSYNQEQRSSSRVLLQQLGGLVRSAMEVAASSPQHPLVRRVGNRFSRLLAAGRVFAPRPVSDTLGKIQEAVERFLGNQEEESVFAVVEPPLSQPEEIFQEEEKISLDPEPVEVQTTAPSSVLREEPQTPPPPKKTRARKEKKPNTSSQKTTKKTAGKSTTRTNTAKTKKNTEEGKKASKSKTTRKKTNTGL